MDRGGPVFHQHHEAVGQPSRLSADKIVPSPMILPEGLAFVPRIFLLARLGDRSTPPVISLVITSLFIALSQGRDGI